MSGRSLVACVDVGSTFTKAALVDVATGALVATAGHPTTLATDVLDGWHACRAELALAEPAALDAEVRACSSAGGGLRIAVAGTEQLVTAEAGRRVALSSGGRVVHVTGGALDDAALVTLRERRPDVLLLVGGTDGGNAEVLLASAAALAGAGWQVPVVLAGNVDARVEAAALLARAGTPYLTAANVLPRVGALEPGPARAAIRETFLAHVIGGKQLSRSPDFAAMVRGATPDVVLAAVELLARGLGPDHPGVGEVAVVDVGGATTDVYSVVETDPEDGGLAREVVATAPVSRTVEGDLGMRWSAVSTVEAGVEAGLVVDPGALREAARRRHADPGLLPDGGADAESDERLAAVAAGVALRRHAGRRQVVYDERGRVVERSGTDLREVDLLVGSGGVLRNAPPEVADRVLAAVSGELPGGWQLPRAPRRVVDRAYVLAAAGLLAGDHPRAAYALLDPLRGA